MNTPSYIARGKKVPCSLRQSVWGLRTRGKEWSALSGHILAVRLDFLLRKSSIQVGKLLLWILGWVNSRIVWRISSLNRCFLGESSRNIHWTASLWDHLKCADATTTKTPKINTNSCFKLSKKVIYFYAFCNSFWWSPLHAFIVIELLEDLILNRSADVSLCHVLAYT